jgi:hypothetical protein
VAGQLKLIAHHVGDGRPDDALLYELVLKNNLPLTGKITAGKIGTQTFCDVADGTLAICLERPVAQETLCGLVACKPKGVICLDIAFAGNDQLKANTVLEMKSHGIEFHTVRTRAFLECGGRAQRRHRFRNDAHFQSGVALRFPPQSKMPLPARQPFVAYATKGCCCV